MSPPNAHLGAPSQPRTGACTRALTQPVAERCPPPPGAAARAQVLLRIIQPYTRVRIPFIAAKLNIPEPDVEQLMVSLILDGRVQGHIDQVGGVGGAPPAGKGGGKAAREGARPAAHTSQVARGGCPARLPWPAVSSSRADYRCGSVVLHTRTARAWVQVMRPSSSPGHGPTRGRQSAGHRCSSCTPPHTSLLPRISPATPAPTSLLAPSPPPARPQVNQQREVGSKQEGGRKFNALDKWATQLKSMHAAVQNKLAV